MDQAEKGMEAAHGETIPPRIGIPLISGTAEEDREADETHKFVDRTNN